MTIITHSLFRLSDDWNAAKSVLTIPSSHALTNDPKIAKKQPAVRILTLEGAAEQLAQGARVETTRARRAVNQTKAMFGLPVILDVTKLSDKVASGEIKPGHVSALAKRFLLPVNSAAIGYSAGKNGYDNNDQILGKYILIANLNEESSTTLLAKIDELRAKNSDLSVDDYKQIWKLAESLQLQQGMKVSDVYSPPNTYTPSDLTPINANAHGEGLYLKAGKDVPFVLIEGGDFCFLTASGPQKAREGKIISVLKDGIWHGLQLEVFLRDNVRPDGARLTQDDVKSFPSVTVVDLLGAYSLKKIRQLITPKP